MKVYILTEGGRDIGFGHITRCTSLYQSFEERGISSKFIVNGENTINGILEGKKYQLFNWLKDENRFFNTVKEDSVVIIDSYLTDYEFYKKVSEIVETPVYIDDNKRLDYPRGFVVNGMAYAGKLDYPKKEDITYLLGSQYAILRKEFWEVPPKNINDNVTAIMITFGGDDKQNITPKVLKLLDEKYARYEKNIIIGRGFRNKVISEKSNSKKTNFFQNPTAEEIRNIMLRSDIAISAGGQTLHELARMGVPTIGICVAENQRANLESWQEKEFIEYVGWHDDDFLIDKIEKAIDGLMLSEIRAKRSEIGKNQIDGKGALRIADRVLQIARDNTKRAQQK